MPNENTRNTILFIVGSVILFFAYQFFVLEPQQKQAAREAKAKAASAQGQAVTGQTVQGAPVISGSTVFLPRAQAIAASPRIKIDTPSLSGSLNLRGARIDDLYLKGYRQVLNKPDAVELLRPDGVQYAFFAQTGWAGDKIPGLPGPDTIWTVKSGDVLAPGRPVTLTYTAPDGLVFTRTISVDDKFMFTVNDTVANLGAAPVTVASYASVQRQDVPQPAPGVHEGAIGVFDGKLKLEKYKAWKKDGDHSFTSRGGWLGITDKYWLAAVLPDQTTPIKAQYRVSQVAGRDIYDANYVGPTTVVPAGRQTTSTTHIFAGAKVKPVLDGYEKSLGVDRFVDAVDWGLLFFLTKPVFWLLEIFYGWVGNFGLAILMMTVVVKLAFFYPANMSFKSMTMMKKVQPQVEELRKRYKDDPAQMQKEMMGLYAREKINPMLGCLPMLATIPVFFSLYKVLNVTIEMRHAPFFGVIHDLSAPDPTTIWNLFGLIPWDPGMLPIIGIGGFLHIGIWALAYGFSTWLVQSMSPPAGDPTQQKIMMFMPVIFTFVLAKFAVGLLIYYTWSNTLSLLQQYVIMRRFKVDNPIDKILRKVTGKKLEPAG
jgi:YidC/Oxa1 family membrane protein insertase